MKSDSTFRDLTRNVDFATCTSNLKDVGAYWASKRIDQLLADIKQYGETAERKDTVIDLSIAFGVLTPYTAFLVLDPTQTRIEAAPQAVGFVLGRSYPNPLSLSRGAQVSLTLDVTHSAPVRVVITDILGRVLRVLPYSFFDQGRHIISWDGRDEAGRFVAPGTYVLRVMTDAGASQQRLVITP
ncbi:MAG: T9SS type A sorting domain-containing protein [Ignavibacteria bacterium]|nr:T9SS type A sorting domain-containing protein [Ignavibacteria bacterium]